MKKNNFSGKKIVVIGGGTGLSSLILGLKKHNKNISAIVTVTDDGGSSGRLSNAYDILPPGDIRNCLASLAESDTLMFKLFNYRFPGASDIAGHSFGNLFIAAITDIFGSFEKAVLETSKILNIEGKVIPVTLEKVSLCCEMENGEIVIGETKITAGNSKIKEVFLNKKNIVASQQALDSIEEADIIIIGPGSLYTSIIPNFLFVGIREAVAKAKAKKVFISNIMTQHGETDNYSIEDHLEVLLKYVGEEVIDFVLVNIGIIPKNLLAKYSKQNSFPVVYNKDDKIFNSKQIFGDVFGKKISHESHYARHDPEKLANVIKLIFEETI